MNDLYCFDAHCFDADVLLPDLLFLWLLANFRLSILLVWIFLLLALLIHSEWPLTVYRVLQPKTLIVVRWAGQRDWCSAMFG